MVVRRAEMLPIECIVRGYLSARPGLSTSAPGPCTAPGAALRDVPSPSSCPNRCSPLREATTGHDENISFDEAADLGR